ncbi:MAG: hypothetical protein NT070_14830 [Cyanobacteria bacterium]|nr:hypothetical protein [Cyanobacteriota bacterium]
MKRIHWLMVPQPALAANILAVVELILLIVLGVEIVIYADLAKGR